MLEISSHVGQLTNEGVLSVFKLSVLDFACWTESPRCFYINKRKKHDPDWSRDLHYLVS